MDFQEFDNEQKKRIQECKTPEDLLALAKSEGYELSEDELQSISGGEDTWDCPEICNK